MYFREGDRLSEGGVGFLVNKVLCPNIVEISSVSPRVAYLIIKISKRYSLKVIQVYAPTSAHSDEEVERLYEDVSSALHSTKKAHFNVVMGDFNAKVGIQRCSESAIGPHGFGDRNQRGHMLVNFLEKEGLYLMNSFFKKQPQRKWTWQSPDGRTRNEIDFIISDKKRIFRDVSVITRFNTGSDHRYLRGTLNINCKLERNRLIKSILRPSILQTLAEPEVFQLKLSNRFASLEPTNNVDQKLQQVIGILRDEGTSLFKIKPTGRKSKLSRETLTLMNERRDNPHSALSSQRILNKKISKMVRRDLRSYNTLAVEKAIEQNRGSKVFAQNLDRSYLTKLTTSTGSVLTSRPEILAEVEHFYGRLYTSQTPKPAPSNKDPRSTLTRHYTDELPEISLDELELALRQLKNGKAPGEDGITTELIKAVMFED
ncbi:unnamed protein product [Colias eurytheme]|nr:unnamed protein product [Colias eurytheme]